MARNPDSAVRAGSGFSDQLPRVLLQIVRHLLQIAGNLFSVIDDLVELFAVVRQQRVRPADERFRFSMTALRFARFASSFFMIRSRCRATVWG
jgi:hypothetical protein